MQRQIALTLAHSLMKARHLEREEALKLAWQVARADELRTRVHGVSFGNRQRLLQRLAQYSPELVQITLVREKNNRADSNAIKELKRNNGPSVMSGSPMAVDDFLADLTDFFYSRYDRKP